MNEPDFIADSGVAFLAHRLRRASDLLVDGAGAWLAEGGMTAPPRALSTLLLLQREGPLTVTGVAERLRVSHPLMIKLLRGLEQQGLVRARRDRADARRRPISLTAKGRQEAELAGAATQALARAYGRLFEETGVDLLDALARLERACAERPFEQRLSDAVEQVVEAQPTA